jgi:DHA3 family macrolide efflux protein-like MFS transporter
LGGFRRRAHGVLLGWILTSKGTEIVFGLGRGPHVWLPAVFLGRLFIPLVNGSNQAIWQAKVAPDLQGRVFSARRLIAWFANPISPIIAGTLADYVLEPAMRSQSGIVAGIFGPLFGIGPGAGMSLLIALGGVGGFLVGLTGYPVPAVRQADHLLPEDDALPAAEAAPAD